MAYRLSFWGMDRGWQGVFSRASAVLALLLVSSLAFAGVACAPGGAEPPGLRAGHGGGCLTAGLLSDACIAVPQRMDVRVAAGAPSSPGTPPAACGIEHAARIFRTTADPQPPLGLAPGSSLPAYILLRRYLS